MFDEALNKVPIEKMIDLIFWVGETIKKVHGDDGYLPFNSKKTNISKLKID
jgi:hypothetical protein